MPIMTVRRANVGGRFVAVERGLWPEFDGWPFRRELDELAMRRRVDVIEPDRRKQATTEEPCKKN
jgi:hypothetical protein